MHSGECIKGFSSPRMKLFVLARARACHHILRSMLNVADTGAVFVAWAWQYLDNDYTLRETIKTDLRLCAGFVDLTSCFSERLEKPDIPNVANLSTIAFRDARRLFAVEGAQRIGRCIGSIIFKMAMNADAVVGFGSRDLDVE